MSRSMRCAALVGVLLQASAVAAEPPAVPEPLPESRSVEQSMVMDGKRFDYRVTVADMAVADKDGKKIADVVITSYTHQDGHANRPVTFALNGGPGAASAFLNYGLIGPKLVRFGGNGDQPSDLRPPEDNPQTWLAFTDLVFIDPVGAGYSRSYLSAEDTRKHFYAVGPDIEYLSQVMVDWLAQNGRMASSKYIAGESYGGFRAPQIAHRLQTTLGIGVSGLVLLSPLLDWGDRIDRDFSPMSWIVALPSMAAVKLQREKALTPEALRPAEDYARGEYAVDLLKGRSDPGAQARIVQRVAELTGLDRAWVAQNGGRIDIPSYLRQLYRDQDRIASIYDATVSAWDPFPYDASRRTGDPILQAVIAPLSTATVDFLTTTLRWPVKRPYRLYDRSISEQWDWGTADMPAECVTDLRQALALDSKLWVVIAYGYTDLITPYFAGRLVIDQMPVMGDQRRVQLGLYEGGHMFYRQAASRQALYREVSARYAMSASP